MVLLGVVGPGKDYAPFSIQRRCLGGEPWKPGPLCVYLTMTLKKWRFGL
jgi:hypothetical protein